ncbi:alpha/beta hydrolase [Pseudooceanicola sediminis]|uniref:Alpha/beta hydrolase n=1 Tax=Pseudooceanicola sediminis TaxID=2211117 RepID=A0A399IZZ4_9RHOB|nr:alpha/beta hydrolase [Pseudooceanicola sediminis]KAA2313657.1 alpha/beta hydrolase [Puniceibacterium sp. HSS470]RII38611.1 alpha/beta hydrolase [Pseudooceanicola sediminis]
MIRLIAALLLALAPAACTTLPGPDRAGTFPLVETANFKPGIKRVIVLIPGAFASVGIFQQVLNWQVPDSAIVAYRFPGLDGLPVDHRVDIRGSAKIIADYVNTAHPEEVYMIGFSTGGPIALETADQLEAPDVSMALISSAGPMPSAMLASARSSLDVIRAMTRAHSTAPQDAWTENYRTLLYGRDHYSDPVEAQESAVEAEAQRPNMKTPKFRMTMAHTASLLLWTPDHALDLADDRIGFFHGAEDPVFPIRAQRRFARHVQADKFFTYPQQGHLLYMTSERLFDDIRHFFELDVRAD